MKGHKERIEMSNYEAKSSAFPIVLHVEVSKKLTSFTENFSRAY